MLLWVSGVAAIVLLIACANVANLLLSRNVRRRREISVRLALGVRRARLVRQFVVEGAVLATLGTIAALFIAQWGGLGIRRLLLPEGSSFNLGRDWRTIGVAALCAVLAVLLSVLGPALLSVRSDISSALKSGVREGTYRGSRLRSTSLVMQGALSVALLVGAGLFVRSLNNVLDIPLGYDAQSVIEVYADFRGVQLDSAARVAELRRLLAAAQAIPGVEAATRVNGGFSEPALCDCAFPALTRSQRSAASTFC